MRIIQICESGYEEGLRQGRAVAGRWQSTETYISDPVAGIAAERRAAARRWQPTLTDPERWEQALRFIGKRDPSLPVEEAVASMRQWTREDLLRCAAEIHRQRMAALPDLSRFPELKGMDQYLDDEARGFADGAGIDVREVYLLWYSGQVRSRAQRSAPPVSGGMTSACSEFYLPETARGPLLGKAWDDNPVWHTPFPESAPPLEVTVTVPPGGRGYRIAGVLYPEGVNEKGLFLELGQGARYEREEPFDDMQFPVPWAAFLLRYCATVDEAVAMFERYHQFCPPCHVLLADAAGCTAVIEKSNQRYVVHRAVGVPALATYGGCQAPELRAVCDTSSPLFMYYERRRQRMAEVIAEAGPDVSLATYWKAALHHDSVAPGCQHDDTRPLGVPAVTVGCVAILPREGRVYLRPTIGDGTGGLRFPCAVAPLEATYSFAW